MNVNVTQTEDVLSGTPPSTITFNAKQTTVTLTVATDDDNADEVASEVTAQVQVGTGYTVGTPSSATVTVNDNDIPRMTITANPASVTEGTAATFTITANPAPATALTVNVNVTQTEDVLSGTPPSTITFNAKQTTATLTVATDDDNADEVASEVTAQVQVGTGYTVGTPSSATVTVNDNDIPQVTITANTDTRHRRHGCHIYDQSEPCTGNSTDCERERHPDRKISSAAHRHQPSPSTPNRPPPHSQ